MTIHSCKQHPKHETHLLLAQFLLHDLFLPGAIACFTPEYHSFKLAGTTGRRVSQGGFLNRVFGSSAHAKKEKDSDSSNPTPRTSTETSNLEATPVSTSACTDSSSASSPPKINLALAVSSKGEEHSVPANDIKKRRSSSAKAAAFLNSAKNTLLGGDREGPLTAMQRLGKSDAALIVPQGSLNNSAGESHQTTNSSFTVGVTEDKNKKCRRTMEDTHSYLYNFLGTPAPVLPLDIAPPSKSTGEAKGTVVDGMPDKSQEPVETDNGYFAIFDGHAGTFAAEWCGKKLHVILEDLMRKNPNTPVPELLDQTFTSADQQLEKLPLNNSGCTAITAVLRWEDRVPSAQSATGSTAIAPAAVSAVKQSDPEQADTPTQAAPARHSIEKASQAVHKIQETASRQRVLYTANVGDARIVLCRNGKALRLSYDHKGSDENEGRRITNAGGLILNNRVNGVLAVTRALGDSYLKDLVTGHPYTTETVIQPDIDEFLILACDGLWDVCSDQEAVDLVRNNPSPQAASKLLVDHALSRFSTDNLSVMVIRFDSKKLQSNTSSNIGVEREDHKTKGPSEVETIVNEARRKSGVEDEGVASIEAESEELKTKAMKQIEEEDPEPGPELSPHGLSEAGTVYAERPKRSGASK